MKQHKFRSTKRGQVFIIKFYFIIKVFVLKFYITDFFKKLNHNINCKM